METRPLEFLSSKVAIGTKLAAMLVIVLAVYHQDLTLIANETLQSEIMSYMLAIPILFAYLTYRKRKMIRAAISFEALKIEKETTGSPSQTAGAVLYKKPPEYVSQIAGVLVCLIAFILYWHGSYTFYPIEYHMISMPIFLSGIILVIFNSKTLKALVFPLALLLFLTPPPQEILSALGAALSITSSESAYTVLKAFGMPVTLTAQYGTPIIMLITPNSSPIAFTIDAACAGFYSLIGFVVFSIFIAYVTKATLLKKTILFLTGIPLMFALNVTRIVTIVAIGNQYGQETALQAFHLFGGWVLILLGSFFLSTISETIFKLQLFTTRQKIRSCNHCNPNPNPDPKQHFCIECGRLLTLTKVRLTRLDIGKILAILAIAVLIINIQAPVFALTEGPVTLNIRTLSGEETTTKMLPQVPDYNAVYVYRDKTFEEQASQDASLIYSYYSNNTSKKTIWAVIEIAKTRASMHPWEVCLITWQIAHGYQPQVIQLGQRDIHLIENPPVTARFFSFQDQKTGYIQVILYWYESSFFNTGSGMEREYAKVSFIAFTKSPEDVPSVEDQLLPFGKAMMDQWLPIKSWSLATLLISQNGPLLMAITVTILVLVLAFQRSQKVRQESLNIKAYDKLVSDQEKSILQAVKNDSGTSDLSSIEIAQRYQELSGKTIEMKSLHSELVRAEEAGFIERELANRDDEPILTWKTQTALFKSSKLQNTFARILNLIARSSRKQTNSA